jgi:hypothetical protein
VLCVVAVCCALQWGVQIPWMLALFYPRHMWDHQPSQQARTARSLKSKGASSCLLLQDTSVQHVALLSSCGMSYIWHLSALTMQQCANRMLAWLPCLVVKGLCLDKKLQQLSSGNGCPRTG